MIFEQYKADLTELIEVAGDIEAIHSMADEILTKIAIDASKGLLTEQETVDLVNLYNKVPKWYA